MIKNFNLSPDYVLWQMSYDNIIMYNAILPSYGTDVNKEENVVDFDELEEMI